MAKFQTEIIEPEEKKEAIINPLDEVVDEKGYASLNVNTSGLDMNAPIAEPTFQPPPISRPKVEEPKPPKPEPVNPEMKHLGKKDTEMAASHMAKLIIQGYEWVHDLANKGLQVSEKKLTKLQAQGEINLNAMIDYDYGKKIRAGDFFQEYNAQVSGLLKVSDEFKEEATPLLEKVLAKRGIGMTDEQMLMFVFGKDIAAKSLMFFQQKAQLNFMIQSIKEATTSAYAQAAPPQQEQREEKNQQQNNSKVEIVEPEEDAYNNDGKNSLQSTKKKGRPRKSEE